MPFPLLSRPDRWTLTGKPELIKQGAYQKLISGLMFLAVCAYIGASAFSALPGEKPQTDKKTADSTRLDGIAVRTEQLVCSVSDLYDGVRVPAGTVYHTADGTSHTLAESAVYVEKSGGLGISPEDLSPFVSKTVEKILKEKAPGREGSALVTDHVWYFAALADTRLEPGRCRILFDGFEAPIEGIITETDGKAVLIKLRTGGAYLSLGRTGAEIYRD